MSKWEEKKSYMQLKDVAEFSDEKIDTKALNSYNYISTENMVAEKGGVTTATSIPLSNKQIKFEENNILLSNIRPYFKKIWFADKMGGCSNDVLVLKSNGKVLSKFLYYVLSDNNFFNYSTITSKGTKMPRGSKTAIMKYLVPKIDFRTQEHIADILSAYDDLIENNNRRIEILEKSAQDLYKEWFVRFRFPNHENTEFVNGLPDGWKIKRLGQLCEITSSKRVYLSDYVEQGIPFYRSKEIIQLANGQHISSELYISPNKFESFKNKFGAPSKNDILITSVGTIGNSYISDGHDFYFKDGNLTWLKTSNNEYLSVFIYSWLNSQQGKQSLNLYTIGTSQSALTIENLRKIKMILPSNNILESYSEKVVGINNIKGNLYKQNQNLKKQRDLLLPRLMSGKLEV